MEKTPMRLQWAGTFLELCMGSVSADQKAAIDRQRPDLAADPESRWYGDEALLGALFGAENWWSLDDLDHVMGLVFADRAALDAALPGLALTIDKEPKTFDPEAVQLSIFAPESMQPGGEAGFMVCHGARREAQLNLAAEIELPFDPSLLTLSLIQYPGHGLILIDLDYDGHDEVALTFGQATYLPPRFSRLSHEKEQS